MDREVRFPDITGFAGTNSRSDQQRECYNRNERVSTENSDHVTVTDISPSRRVVDQFVTDTPHAGSPDSSFAQLAEQPNHSSISCSPANQHCSRSPVSTQVAEQTCSTQTTCMSPSEDMAEQSDSHLFTTLAEQSQRSRVAREAYRKLPAEQHVQSVPVEHHSTPIQSRTIRSSGRTTKQPSYLKDYVLGLDIMHQCDTCGKIYSLP